MNPPGYDGNVLCCDPANNLVHRDILDFTQGAAAVAKRADDGCEFLASTDNWFRPVFLTAGPDGAMYVLDFYREVIETPLSLPDDIKAKLNLKSRGRGRIWRVRAESAKPGKCPDFTAMTDADLARKLLEANSWTRGTARRLLLERGTKGLALATEPTRGKQSRPDVLSAKAGLQSLTEPDLFDALTDPEPGNRVFALTLAEERIGSSPPLWKVAERLVDDPLPAVRFQLALSLRAAPVKDAVRPLTTLVAKDGVDPWVQTAVLLSAREGMADLIAGLLAVDSPAAVAMLPRAAAVVAGKGDDAAVARLLTSVLEKFPGVTSGLAAVLDGVAAGKGRGRISKLPDPAAKQLSERFALAMKACEENPTAVAARLLAHDPSPAATPVLARLLSARVAADVQLAAVRSLAARPDAVSARAMLAAWPELGPTARREVLEHLVARAEWAGLLLEAIAAGKVPAGGLDPARIAQLKAHPNAGVRTRAATVLASVVPSDRKKLIESYSPALDSPGDSGKGKVVFKTNCATCHRLDGEGFDVGPNLVAAVPGKTKADLLVAVLDPNREVDARYVGYTATLLDGRQVTGILAAEGPGSITLRRADGVEDVVRRSDIDSLRSSGVSLMPEGLEKTIPLAAMNDLLAYLQTATKPK
jgi:putative heme-binding domain-containing protein